jgi:hypothetical protein
VASTLHSSGEANNQFQEFNLQLTFHQKILIADDLGVHITRGILRVHGVEVLAVGLLGVDILAVACFGMGAPSMGVFGMGVPCILLCPCLAWSVLLWYAWHSSLALGMLEGGHAQRGRARCESSYFLLWHAWHGFLLWHSYYRHT